VSPRNHVLDGGPDPPMGRVNFEGGVSSIVKHRETLQSSVQKRLNRSRCRLDCGLGWAVGITCYVGVQQCRGSLPWQPILGLKLLLSGFV